MIKAQGEYYPKDSAACQQVCLQFQGDDYYLLINDSVFEQGQTDQLIITDRVGNIPRRVQLNNGGEFSTEDNDAIDLALKGTSKQKKSLNLLHNLESHWGWISASVVFCIVFVVLTVGWGIPAASSWVAMKLPASVAQKLGDGSLETMDKLWLKPTKIDETKQAEITQRFNELRQQLSAFDSAIKDYNFNLHFREMRSLPNAFALPSGDVIVTDELVKISQNQHQLDSILLHEIAHVVHRHSMKQAVRGAAFTILLSLYLGDVSGVAEMLIAIPVLLMESSYSREHETESDEYALKMMIEMGIDPIHFADIMNAMTRSIEKKRASEKDSSNEKITLENKSKDNEEQQDLDKVFDYFSSHPITETRIDKAKELSIKFRSEQCKLMNRKDVNLLLLTKHCMTKENNNL